MNKKIIWWIVSIIIVAGAIYGLIVLSRQPQAERPGEAISIQGQQHISIGETHPEYNSNPPTSGWHYAGSAKWGFYDKELPDEQVIHNLEHGGIWISYKDVDEATKVELEKIAKSSSKIIVTPRSKNDAPIVLASWGRLQKLEQFDEVIIKNFIKANKNKSPEPLAM